MSSNYKKRPILGVVMIIIAILVIISSMTIRYFINDKISVDTIDLIFAVLIALLGILMFFINIKSYGWAIAFLIGISGIITYLFESKSDMTSLFSLIVISALSLGMLIFKNTKK